MSKSVENMKAKMSETNTITSYALEYVGNEDFCQLESFISHRLYSLINDGKTLCGQMPKLECFTVMPVKVVKLDQLLSENAWLSLIDYDLNVQEEILSTQMEPNFSIASLKVQDGSLIDSTINPFKVVVKDKNATEQPCTETYNESANSFSITSRLATPGVYSFELYIGNKLIDKRSFTLLHEQKAVVEKGLAAVPFGQKERLDHLEDDQFLESEMQCPVCKEEFCFEEEKFPRLLPCLHVVGGNCLNSCIADGQLTCPCCNETHNLDNGDTMIFPKDQSKQNLAIYWKIRSEKDNILCQELSDGKATYWCQRCGMFYCETCSCKHSENGHKPLVPLLHCQDPKSMSIAELHRNIYCETAGHDDKQFEFFCVPCQQILCVKCYLEEHKTHEVQSLTQVYEQLYDECNQLLRRVSQTKADASNLSSEVNEEIKNLKLVSDAETRKIRKVFNNCKITLEQRIRELEISLQRACEVKEAKLKMQLEEVKRVETILEGSVNRTLNLMEFSNEVSFLRIFKSLEQRLKLNPELQGEHTVCEKALVLYLDTNASKRVQAETKNIGNIWPGDICLSKSICSLKSIAPNIAGQLMKLQLFDRNNKPISLNHIKQYITAILVDSTGATIAGAVSKIEITDTNTLLVYGCIREPGKYNLMLNVADIALMQKGYQVTVGTETTNDCSDDKTSVHKINLHGKKDDINFLESTEEGQRISGEADHRAGEKISWYTTKEDNSEQTSGEAEARESIFATAARVIDASQEIATTNLDDLRGVPDAPIGPVKITRISNNSVELEWSTLEGLSDDQINAYDIQICKDDGDWFNLATSSETNYTARGLFDGIGYRFRIAAVNESGEGPRLISDLCNLKTTAATDLSVGSEYRFSNAAVKESGKGSRLLSGVYTLETTDAVPDAPKGPIKITRINNNSVELEWSTPEGWSADQINAYDVKICEDDGDWFDLDPAWGTGYVLTNMPVGSEYRFSVAAVNEGGEGQRLMSEVYTLETTDNVPDAPKGPVKITRTNYNSVKLEWSTPVGWSDDEINAYDIKICKDVGYWLYFDTAWESSFEVTNMPIGIDYRFSIAAAVNEGGEGHRLMSDVYTLKTTDNVPDAPKGPVKITRTNYNSVKLEWSTPVGWSDDEINAYDIKISQDDGDWFYLDTAWESSYMATDLSVGSEYRFSIAAVNESGEGSRLVSGVYTLETTDDCFASCESD